MRKNFHCVAIMVLLLFFPNVSRANIPNPARVGGTITINGVLLTDSSDAGYTIKITRQDGTALNPPAEDIDGLNSLNWYNIDIPLYDAIDQPGGVNPGSTVVIHVYKGNKEITIISPLNGEITVGASWSITQVDLVLKKPNSLVPVIFKLLMDD